MNPHRLIRGVLLLPWLFLVAGCDLPGQPAPSSRFQRAETVLKFAPLFHEHCAGCHGAEGKLGAGPPLNDDLFRATVPQSEIEMLLNHGRHGTLMPAFAQSSGGPLTEAQVQVLVHEIKGIAYRIDKMDDDALNAKVVADELGVAPAWGVPKPAPDAPPYAVGKDGNREAGLKVFQSACAGCHGNKGQGLEGPRPNRINDPAFLALSSDQVLRRYIITGRPDLHMPNYRGTEGRADAFTPLTAEQVADLTALMAYWRINGE
jgi:cytochrome c oxidase cbb3-type subunit 3/ubiquinol-cytochrome c reductase cytochrome c subunit